ncbi:MAG: FAD:protein FMN transferase [Candidatus Nanopelagicales bacterium]
MSGPEMSASHDVSSATFPLWGGTATVLSTEPRALPAVLASVRATLAEVELGCSAYRDDSDLNRVNRALGRPVVVGPILLTALEVALRAARVTGGLVDPTVGAVTQPGAPPRRGPRPVAADGRPLGWADVEVDPVVGSVRLPPGLRLDLGATAKAWAADLCLARAMDVADCFGSGLLVSLAGDLAVAGPAPDGGWRVRVTDDHRTRPDDLDVPGTTVTLVDGALATSSITVRERTGADGSAAAHIVDPLTWRPVRPRFRTVSVAASSCVDANTGSTAALVMSADPADWLRERGLPARLVATDGQVTTVAGWPADPAPGEVAA